VTLFPWQKRAQKEKKLRENAETDLAHAQAQWPHIYRAIAPLRRERLANGWTELVADIFGDSPPRKERRQ
jgi:hypothetical protein